MSDCEYSNRLADFLSGRSPDDDWPELERHLSDCDECSATIDGTSADTDDVLSVLRDCVFGVLSESDLASGAPNGSGLSSEAINATAPRAEAIEFIERLKRELGERLRASKTDAGSVGTEQPGGGPQRSPASGQQDQAGSQHTLPEIPGCRDLRVVGRGGMGLIVRAWREVLEREVAIKLPMPSAIADERRTERFLREIRIQAQLRNEHIVPVVDAGRIDGRPYVIMDWINGLDVGRVAAKCAPLSIADACEIVRQAALGLEHAHQFRQSDGRRLIHRDIKPSNLMLNADGCVLVADFGLAVLTGLDADFTDPGDGIVSDQSALNELTVTLDRLTRESEIVGTLDYIAPEQCQPGGQIDARTDLYSLGITLWRLLAGSLPFDGPRYQTDLQKLMAHRSENVPNVRTRKADVPRKLDQLIAEMTDRDASLRPESVTEVARRLEPFCKGADLRSLLQQARNENASQVSATLARRRRQKVFSVEATAGLVTLVLAAAVVIVIIQTQRGDIRLAVDTDTGEVTRLDASGGEGLVKADATAAPAIPDPAAIPLPDDPVEPVGPDAREVLSRFLNLGGEVHVRDLRTGSVHLIGRAAALPAHLEGTRSISLSNSTQLRDEDLADLSQFTQLESLHLNVTPIGNAGMAHIAKLSNLRDLGVFATRISDSGMVHLRSLRELRILHLAITGITDDGLRNLAELEHLEWLALVKCHRVTGAAFEDLQKLQNLKYLDLNNTGLDDEGLRWICQLPAIEYLHTVGTPISDAGMVFVARLKKLRQFHPNNTSLSDDGLLLLSECRELEELGLNGTRVGDRSLSVIGKLPKLSLLALQDTAVTDTGLAELAGLSNLRRLLLIGSKVSDEGVAELREQLPECEIDFPSPDHRVAARCLEVQGKVRFHDQQQFVAHPSQLVRNDRALLQVIDLSERTLPPDLLPAIANLKSLHSLNLSKARLSAADLEQVSRCRELRYLWLTNVKLPAEAYGHLATATQLELLDLSGTSLTDAGIERLLHLKRLKELILAGTTVTNDGATRLQAALPDCVVTR
ncbi:protein kinase [bacterium]|nr:protein kinase [bacterium]